MAPPSVQPLRFFVKWHVVNERRPADPKTGILEMQDQLTTLKANMQNPASPIVDWGCFGNGKEGYLIIEASKESDVLAALLWHMPGFEFEDFVLLTVDDVLAATAYALAHQP